MEGTNPNYLAYCRAQGRTPEAQFAYDVEAWPGGCMAGFLLWMRERRRAYFAANPEGFFNPNDSASPITDLEGWGKFLASDAE